MNEQQVEETELRRYLLGGLTLEERVLIEARMFLDSAYMQLARAVKDELVDDYVNHDFTPAEREMFESHVLAQPGSRDDLRIAQALKKYLASQAESADVAPAPEPVTSRANSRGPARTAKESGRSFLRFLFGRKAVLGFSFAAALIVLSVIAWLTVVSWRRPPMQAQDPPQQTTPGRQQQSPESADAPPDNSRGPGAGGEIAGGQDGGQRSATPGGRQGDGPAGRQGRRTQGAPPPTGRAPMRVATFVLLPGGGVRGEGGGESVSIAADTGTVVLRLPLVGEEDFSSYSARLETGGRVVHTFNRLPAEVDPELGSVVQVRVPADLLRVQSYQVKLSGVTAGGPARSLSSYAFVVERR